ncbi:MAG: hypothetical protein JW786_11855 [Desulfobacterales bacterium]|nr:hypothetical protein [Desulfobacterales bacterium]
MMTRFGCGDFDILGNRAPSCSRAGLCSKPDSNPIDSKIIEKVNIFECVPPKEISDKHILAVHDTGYFKYFKRVCATIEPQRPIYPYVFPIRNVAKPPQKLAVRAGYYCIDTFIPLSRNAFTTARRAVDCALTAAFKLTEGAHAAYPLVRPPDHHAEHRIFGGFCYFSSAAIAANDLEY